MLQVLVPGLQQRQQRLHMGGTPSPRGCRVHPLCRRQEVVQATILSATIGRRQDAGRKQPRHCKLPPNRGQQGCPAWGRVWPGWVLVVDTLRCRTVLGTGRRMPALTHPGTPPAGRVPAHAA